ncbi:MAG TPA: Gfo/Idh/MocA family oxidoreductase [Thermoanaerobaculia bacterium]|nr:Gfo/Idh/MocA family oxidoreductase [Thermoanaerobaculia bacterium]
MRIAICGLGAAARNIHIPAYRRVSGVQLVSGCDPDPKAREAVKKDVPALFDNLELMLREVRPDAVSICTPPALHHRQILQVLEQGSHVFAEKPLCETLEQADEIIEAAHRAGKRVVVNTQFPAMNIYRESKRRIGSPEFGRLLFVHAWQTFNPTAQTEAGWRGELRRRVCFEFGIHVFELVRFFFDAEPARLFAHMPSPPGATSDVLNTIALEFEDGRAATVVLDRLNKGQERYLELRLDGEEATIQTSIGGSLEVRAGIDPRRRRPFLRVDAAGGGTAYLQQGSRSTLIAREGLHPFVVATARQFEEFMEEVSTGKACRATAAGHRKTLALVLASYRSAERMEVVDLGKTNG